MANVTKDSGESIQHGPRPRPPRSVSVYTVCLSRNVAREWFIQTTRFLDPPDEHRRRDHVSLPRIFKLLLRIWSRAYASPAHSREPDPKRNNGDLKSSSIHELSHSFALPFRGTRLQQTLSTVKLHLASFGRRHLLQHHWLSCLHRLINLLDPSRIAPSLCVQVFAQGSSPMEGSNSICKPRISSCWWFSAKPPLSLVSFLIPFEQICLPGSFRFR